jgi:two-component system phosphate regulon sensor histidine kinase PhoR
VEQPLVAAAGIVAVLAVDGSRVRPRGFPLAVAVLLAAAVLPVGDTRQSGERNGDRGTGCNGFPASDLAAAIADPLIIFDHAATIVYQRGRLCRLWRDRLRISLSLKFAPKMQALLTASVGERRIGYRRLHRKAAGRTRVPGECFIGQPRH